MGFLGLFIRMERRGGKKGGGERQTYWSLASVEEGLGDEKGVIQKCVG